MSTEIINSPATLESSEAKANEGSSFLHLMDHRCGVRLERVAYYQLNEEPSEGLTLLIDGAAVNIYAPELISVILDALSKLPSEKASQQLSEEKQNALDTLKEFIVLYGNQPYQNKRMYESWLRAYEAVDSLAVLSA